jgi:hypothetical protein
MLVMVSGPVSAESDKMRMDNTARLNRVAAAVLKRGHIPLVGVNAAAPVVEEVGVADKYATTMMICEALAERCDAILLIGESSGSSESDARLLRCLAALSTVNDWSLLLEIEARACRQHVKRQIVQLEPIAVLEVVQVGVRHWTAIHDYD